MKDSDATAGVRLHPSPALVIRADTPIKNVLESMQTNRVGSILVVSDRGDGELVGIFTERDLLNKFLLVASSQSWARPIRTVMESPVITLGVDEFDSASQRMLDRGFRHLPVTYKDEHGKTRIAGVLSMRDLFRALVLEKSQKTSDVPPEVLSVGVATEDGGLFRFLSRSLQSVLHADVERLGFRGKLPQGTALKDLERLQLLVIDLDDYEPKAWADFLRLALRTQIAGIHLLYDPAVRSRGELDLLGKLENAARISIFSKPLNVFSIIDRARSS